MIETLYREKLKEVLSSRKGHQKGNVLDVLPFGTKREKGRKAIKEDFNRVLGEYVRNISRLSFGETNFRKKELYVSEHENEFSESIAEQVEFTQEEDDKFEFVRFLDQFLFEDDQIKPIHPYMYNYLKTKNDYKKEFGKYAQFMNEVFVRGNEEIKEIFNSKKSDDILTELILNNLQNLHEREDEPTQYQVLVNPFVKLYQEDLLYISKSKEYFLSHFPLLTHFYIFMYACQLVVKFEMKTNADYDNIESLYFALDWESVNKRRKAAGDLIGGFKYIKEKSVNLFPHIHTISQLSHNSFNKELYKNGEPLKFLPYSTLYEMIKNENDEYQEAFLLELKGWIKDYKKIKNVDLDDESKDIPEAFNTLFRCLKAGMSKSVCEDYGKNIQELGGNQFIKTRGNLGQILNINQEFLLLLTAVSVKNKRIPLKSLFNEFEKRGVSFDRYSKLEIIKLFDSLNIIDKKSDSGDAQYVNPIL